MIYQICVNYAYFLIFVITLKRLQSHGDITSCKVQSPSEVGSKIPETKPVL